MNKLSGKAFFHEGIGGADYRRSASSGGRAENMCGVFPERRDSHRSGSEESNLCAGVPPYADYPYGG